MIHSTSGSTQFQIDASAVKDIEKKLGEFHKKKAPAILARAVNDTAVKARKLLAAQAQKNYAIKSSGFNAKAGAKDFPSAMGIKKAKAKNPVAIIETKGGPIELFKFKTSPASYKTGDKKPKKTRARVKVHGGMKNLLVDGRWAFVTQFKSGHKTLVQRVSKNRFPIKTLLSPSIPQMIGNEKEVYGIVAPELNEMLQRHIQEQIDKELAKGG